MYIKTTLVFISPLIFMIIGAESPVGESDRNIAFDTADLTFDYETDNNRVIQLQAYKSIKNDDIISRQNVSKYGQLQWFSIGYPKLTILSSNPVHVLRFNTVGFIVEVNMLSNDHKDEFVKAIERKYNINVLRDQIVNLVPSSFQCSLKFYSGKDRVLIYGKAVHLTEFPLQVQFEAPLDTKERYLLKKKVDSSTKLDLNFECHLSSSGKIVKVNTFSITGQQMDQLSLVNDLFGPATAVYVTRQQMSDLSSDLYVKLNVIEDYEIPETTFSENFIQELLQQTSDLIEKQVPFETALKALSPYNFDGDLKADITTLDYGKILSISTTGSKKYIKLDQDYYEHLKTKSHQSGSGSISGGYGPFSASASASFVNEKESDWAKSNKTLDEQLNELNNHNDNQMEWKIEGEKIVPKSIKVSRLLKSKFTKSISFNRIRREYFNNKYSQAISLSTLATYFNYESSISVMDKVKSFTDKIDSLKDEIKTLKLKRHPHGTILAVASKSILNYFDKDGKGFDDYLGWYLCDGRNSSPDLKGKFLVGYDPNNNDYNKIGNLGGADYVKLTIQQLPSHTHADSGHRHKIELNTNSGGSHRHEYKDIYFSELSRHSDDWVHVPNSLGSGKSNNDDVGHQFSRNTDFNGLHSHMINGYTESSSASLSYVGSNERIENRPPYYVVAYIVFLGSL